MFLSFRTIAVLHTLVWFTLGCASKSESKNVHIIEVDASSLAYYWVANAPLIDWEALLGSDNSVSNSEQNQYDVSFKITTKGNVAEIRVINKTSGHTVNPDLFRNIAEYRFSPTIQNPTRQAVQVKTLVIL